MLYFFELIFLLLLCNLSFSQERGPSAETAVGESKISEFVIPQTGRMKKNIDFWILVNSNYSSQQGLVHDAECVDRIYEILDFKKSRLSRSVLVNRARAKWKKVLLSVHQKQSHPEQFKPDEKHVFEMFKDVSEPNKFLNAAHRKRLRFQLGQKDHFLNGLYQSGKYLKGMEEVFRSQNLPIELTRLPFVESSFNLSARSKVGASGIWQFMKSTAALFIQVNEAVDERNDPIRATEAAAQLLSLNYHSLKSWPLAVTAYNHGRKSLMRAVRKVGSENLDELITENNNRSFGFASGNFYAELLALVELEKGAGHYFGKEGMRAEPLSYFEIKLPDFIQLSDLMKEFKFNPRIIIDFNPGLSDLVLTGKLLIPAGYRFRMPKEPNEANEMAQRHFLETYEQIPSFKKEKAQRFRNYDRE